MALEDEKWTQPWWFISYRPVSNCMTLLGIVILTVGLYHSYMGVPLANPFASYRPFLFLMVAATAMGYTALWSTPLEQLYLDELHVYFMCYFVWTSLGAFVSVVTFMPRYSLVGVEHEVVICFLFIVHYLFVLLITEVQSDRVKRYTVECKCLKRRWKCNKDRILQFLEYWEEVTLPAIKNTKHKLGSWQFSLLWMIWARKHRQVISNLTRKHLHDIQNLANIISEYDTPFILQL